MAQIVVRIPEDMAEWLEAEHPGRGDVSKLVRRLLTAERLNGSKEVMPSEPAESSNPSTGLPVNGGVKAPSKAKACAHSETTFKMGARYCVKCGEFV